MGRARSAVLLGAQVLVLAATGCSSTRPVEPLFGRPTGKTGLSADDCRPWCGDCDGGTGWSPLDDAAMS